MPFSQPLGVTPCAAKMPSTLSPTCAKHLGQTSFTCSAQRPLSSRSHTPQQTLSQRGSAPACLVHGQLACVSPSSAVAVLLSQTAQLGSEAYHTSSMWVGGWVGDWLCCVCHLESVCMPLVAHVLQIDHPNCRAC